MNDDLKRQVEKERREKAGHAKKLREMRNEGAASSDSDLARNAEAEKSGLKAARNVQAALRKK